MYGYLSDYTHSGYLSLLQILQSDNVGKQKEGVENGLTMIMIILSMAISALTKKYPQTRSALETDPTTTMLIEALCLECNYFG